jgi:large subunit ribosomal protein L28
VAGRSIARRGKAKRLGGVGRKVTGITKRKFKPNIQRIRAVIDGKVCRIKVSAKAIRMGLIEKPTKRDYKSAENVSD